MTAARIQVVLDASVVLAYLRKEGGTDKPFKLLGTPAVSAVNLSEVVMRLDALNVAGGEVQAMLKPLLLRIVEFDEHLAYATAALRPMTRHLGLSLGDRACLATAKRLGVPAVTADRNWAGLTLGIDIKVIR